MVKKWSYCFFVNNFGLFLKPRLMNVKPVFVCIATSTCNIYECVIYYMYYMYIIYIYIYIMYM